MRFLFVPKSMTLDDVERPKRTFAEKSRFTYGAHQKNLNDDRPILSAEKRRSVIFTARQHSLLCRALY